MTDARKVGRLCGSEEAGDGKNERDLKVLGLPRCGKRKKKARRGIRG